MTHTSSTRTPRTDRRPPQGAPTHDRFARFNDEDLERALRAVSWNPKDVANFLRTHASR